LGKPTGLHILKVPTTGPIDVSLRSKGTSVGSNSNESPSERIVILDSDTDSTKTSQLSPLAKRRVTHSPTVGGGGLWINSCLLFIFADHGRRVAFFLPPRIPTLVGDL
jgi:hypothetical protein